MVMTYKLKLLHPNKEKAKLLDEILVKQTLCVNYWIDKIREIESTNIKKLQDRFYREARLLFDLSADMTQLAEFTAIRIARTAKKRMADAPHLTKGTITIKKMKVENGSLGVTFGQGRIWFPFKSRDLPKGTVRESKLKKIDGEWYCFLALEVLEQKLILYKRTMGVDLGLAKIATVSDWNGNNTKFFRGEQLRNKRKHYYNLRKELQSKLHQGNVYKVLKRISNKESNWMRTKNHEISRRIVNMAIKNKRTIAVENLSGIRERIHGTKKTRRMLHSWSFRQLLTFIEYKARLAGLPSVSVDPRETSRICPKCHYVARNNRKSQERFRCNKCLYESNADRIAAMNIAQRATELLASR